MGFILGEGAIAARQVTVVGGLYFYYFGAQVGKKLGAEGSGYVIPQLDNLDPLEGFYFRPPPLLLEEEGKVAAGNVTKGGCRSTSRDVRATVALPVAVTSPR